MRFREVSRIMITDDCPIKTEAQLCYYIYRNHGLGRFMCLAFQKGCSGFWNYWIGSTYNNGFIRESNRSKEIEKLKKDFHVAKSYEEKERIEEDIQFEKEIYKDDKKTKRRGPIGLIKMRPGQLHKYEVF